MEWNPRENPVPPEEELKKTQSDDSSGKSAIDYADRRSEQRFNASGPVNLCFDEPVRQEIVGTLVDYSASGFRAVHHCASLHTGQLVEFRHTVSSGTARVIWNRILPERVESGFIVLQAA